MGFTEASTIQAALLEWAEDAGWEHVTGTDLPGVGWSARRARRAGRAVGPRSPRSPEPGPRLGPDAADNLDAVLHEVNQAILDAHNGLVAANERLTVMLRGDHAFKTVDGKHVPRRFFDFDDPDANRLTVSDEVTIRGGAKPRRFDVVYYVNGIPLVVAETKTPGQAPGLLGQRGEGHLRHLRGRVPAVLRDQRLQRRHRGPAVPDGADPHRAGPGLGVLGAVGLDSTTTRRP